MSLTRFAIAGACLVVLTGRLGAQNYFEATQQAKRDSALNNAEQQRIQREANGAAPAAALPAAPVNPALQATLKNIAGLQGDFSGLVATNEPGADRKMALLNDLSQAAQGAKPSTDSVQKLANDLTGALAGTTKLAVPQQTRLAQQVHALFNSSHLSGTQQQTLLTSIQKILTDAGAPLSAATDVASDLKAIVAQTK